MSSPIMTTTDDQLGTEGYDYGTGDITSPTQQNPPQPAGSQQTSQQYIPPDSMPNPLEQPQQYLEAVLRQIANVDKEGFFQHPVDETIAPGYFKVISRPMSFDVMRDNIQNDRYTSFRAFREDFDQIIINARKYNSIKTLVYKASGNLAKHGAKIIAQHELDMRKAFSKIHPTLSSPTPSIQLPRLLSSDFTRVGSLAAVTAVVPGPAALPPPPPLFDAGGQPSSAPPSPTHLPLQRLDSRPLTHAASSALLAPLPPPREAVCGYISDDESPTPTAPQQHLPKLDQVLQRLQVAAQRRLYDTHITQFQCSDVATADINMDEATALSTGDAATTSAAAAITAKARPKVPHTCIELRQLVRNTDWQRHWLDVRIRELLYQKETLQQQLAQELQHQSQTATSHTVVGAATATASPPAVKAEVVDAACSGAPHSSLVPQSACKPPVPTTDAPPILPPLEQPAPSPFSIPLPSIPSVTDNLTHQQPHGTADGTNAPDPDTKPQPEQQHLGTPFPVLLQSFASTAQALQQPQHLPSLPFFLARARLPYKPVEPQPALPAGAGAASNSSSSATATAHPYPELTFREKVAPAVAFTVLDLLEAQLGRLKACLAEVFPQALGKHETLPYGKVHGGRGGIMRRMSSMRPGGRGGLPPIATRFDGNAKRRRDEMDTLAPAVSSKQSTDKAANVVIPKWRPLAPHELSARLAAAGDWSRRYLLNGNKELQDVPAEVRAVLVDEGSSSEDTSDEAYVALHKPLEEEEQRKYSSIAAEGQRKRNKGKSGKGKKEGQQKTPRGPGPEDPFDEANLANLQALGAAGGAKGALSRQASQMVVAQAVQSAPTASVGTLPGSMTDMAAARADSEAAVPTASGGTGHPPGLGALPPGGWGRMPAQRGRGRVHRPRGRILGPVSNMGVRGGGVAKEGTGRVGRGGRGRRGGGEGGGRRGRGRGRGQNVVQEGAAPPPAAQ